MKKIITTLAQKWPEYLLEILVITIGILGAFTLNNWNENRKGTEREVKFYQELVSDLEDNRVEIGGIKEELKSTIKSIIKIHNYLTTNTPPDDSLKMHFEALNDIGIFNSHNSAFQKMQSGAIELKNDTLRSKIIGMYERHFFNIHFRNNKQWEMLDNRINPFMTKHFTQSMDNDAEGFVLMNEASDYQALRTNSEFQNLYLNLKNWAKLRLRLISQTETELNALIIEVNQEIKRL